MKIYIVLFILGVAISCGKKQVSSEAVQFNEQSGSLLSSDQDASESPELQQHSSPDTKGITPNQVQLKVSDIEERDDIVAVEVLYLSNGNVVKKLTENHLISTSVKNSLSLKATQTLPFDESSTQLLRDIRK